MALYYYNILSGVFMIYLVFVLSSIVTLGITCIQYFVTIVPRSAIIHNIRVHNINKLHRIMKNLNCRRVHTQVGEWEIPKLKISLPMTEIFKVAV